MKLRRNKPTKVGLFRMSGFFRKRELKRLRKRRDLNMAGQKPYINELNRDIVAEYLFNFIHVGHCIQCKSAAVTGV